MGNFRSDARCACTNSLTCILEEIQKAVEERLAARSGESFDVAHDKSFAVFDFDNTSIINDLGDAVFNYVCGHELLKDRTLLGEQDDSPEYFERVFHTNLALQAQRKLRAAYTLCIRMFSGFSPGEAEAATLTAISEEGTKLGSKILFGAHIERGLQVRKPAMELMDFLREKGVDIWIVSASPEPAVRAAMQHFGIEAKLIGAQSVVESGVYTQQLIEPIPMFQGKAESIRNTISATNSPLVAVGDSKNDEEMVRMADIGIAIEGRELSEQVHANGWFVI